MRNINDIRNITKRGVFDLPRDEYFASTGLNPSSITQGIKSPKHLKFAYEGTPVAPTPAMVFGSLVHLVMLEPHKVKDLQNSNEGEFVAIYDGRRVGRSWAMFQHKNQGKLIVTETQYLKAMSLLASAVKEPLFMELVHEGVAEQSIYTEECGLQCRGMVDWIATDSSTLVDVKTSRSIVARQFGQSYVGFGYDIKMALYKHWLEREAKKQIKHVILVTLESAPPYDIAIVPLPPVELEHGLEVGLKIIQRVKECIDANDWPGIAEGKLYPLERPNWSMTEEEPDAWEIPE